jgi:chorismate synthase
LEKLMASNSFGKVFRITTWGETHGPAIGVVIDGCPAGIALVEEDLQQELNRRKPGTSPYTSPRKEKDKVSILSGVFEGKTTGAPIALLIPNEDADPSKYEPMKDLFRPGHANFTYLAKYGIFDHRGGGRSSARETVSRVAAGAIAKKLLKLEGIEVFGYIKQIGSIKAETIDLEFARENPLFCPDEKALGKMMELIESIKAEGDSIGSIVELTSTPLPVGLGDPTYEKLEANLANAMLSIHASKGIEFGDGFGCATMKGSEHNDAFPLTTNHAGGTLGGISSGQPLLLRVAFKPPSSIAKPQTTLTTQGTPTIFALPAGSRHDPCLGIRAVPVVEAMAALVLADALLMNSIARTRQPMNEVH